MPYVTPTQLADLPGSQELAQVATAKHRPLISAVLMEATLRGGDRSAFTPEQIADADDALARIQAITETDDLVNGYLARRYTLPLPSTPGPLVTWSRHIVRYKLHGDRISGDGNDPVVRDYKDAIRFLEKVAKGEFSLGLEDPTTGDSAPGSFQFDTGSKVFGREHLP